MQSRTASQFLNPDVISKLHGLDLRARTVVSGVLSGMHRSIYRGQSVEFAEHRPYVPGDDIRRIDWRLFGRKDRFFIKQYEEETNLRCNLLLDVSASMRFTSGALTKFEYGACLAAALGYLLTQQHDAVGALTFDHAVRQKLAPATGRAQLANLITVLETSTPAERTDMKALFHQLAEQLRSRSLVVLISDLLANADEIVAGLEHICYSGHELVLLHVLDPQEWEFPYVENTLFIGLEDQAQLLADPQTLRSAYRAALADFSARIRAACLKHRADYVPVNTADPLDVVLSGYLSRRSGRSGPVHLAAEPDGRSAAAAAGGPPP